MGRDIWRSSDPNFCWNQVLISGCSCTCQSESLIYPVNRILSLLCATHSSWFSWFRFSFSAIFTWRFPDTVHVCYICPVTTHLWTEHFHLLYSHLLESGKLLSAPQSFHFSRLNKPYFFILPSCIRFSNALVILVTPPLNSIFSISAELEDQNWTQHSSCGRSNVK